MFDRFDTWLILGLLVCMALVTWRTLAEIKRESREEILAAQNRLKESQAEAAALRARLSALQAHRGEIIDSRVEMAKEETERLHQKLAAKDVLLEQYRRQIERKAAVG